MKITQVVPDRDKAFEELFEGEEFEHDGKSYVKSEPTISLHNRDLVLNAFNLDDHKMSRFNRTCVVQIKGPPEQKPMKVGTIGIGSNLLF